MEIFESTLKQVFLSKISSSCVDSQAKVIFMINCVSVNSLSGVGKLLFSTASKNIDLVVKTIIAYGLFVVNRCLIEVLEES